MPGTVRGKGAPSLVEILRRRAQQHPDRIAFTFLADGEDEDGRFTYGELDRRSRAFAAHLQEIARPGDRVVLFYPPGLDYIVSFFGCLYGGMVAVPAYPPRPNRNLDRVRAIAASARPAAAFSTARFCQQRDRWQDQAPEVAQLPWLAAEDVDEASAQAWREVRPGRGDLAFLQYTSGSTSVPKGVMVSHGNLLANLDYMRRCNGYSSRSRAVSWLPLFHDMGLIGNMLEAVYVGFPCTLLPPPAFLQKPVRWLRAITRYRATISGAPNFAYELCVNHVTQEQRETLDLSSWNVAFNGAEPVRARTIDRFSQYFRPAGFRRRTFLPCYGLAEGTLMVSGGRRRQVPRVQRVDPGALEQGRIEESPSGAEGTALVGSGEVAAGFEVRIVDPRSRRLAAPRQVGEIWIAGESVAGGYFDLPEATEESFGARIEPTGDGPYFRTGDLGFLVDGELYVTGRLKDLIILRGRNHYPQDVELCIEESHGDLRAGCSAAFTVDPDGEEQLVVVAEVRRTRKPDLGGIYAAARQAVTEVHEIELAELLLVRSGTIPKTSSGKIQRRKCRDLFLQGALQALGRWRRGQSLRGTGADGETGETAPAAPRVPEGPGGAAGGLESWIAERVARHLGCSPRDIDLRAPFQALGLDSASLVRLSGELEEHRGERLSPTLLYEQPTIERLASHLEGRPMASGPAPAPPPSTAAGEPIALVGIGCRFPGAAGPEAFWRLLREGRDAISEVPASRWDIDELYDPDPDRPGTMNTRWGGFLEAVDAFDPSFFGISPREAERMDPQQRLLLETAFEALEDAGLPLEGLAGTDGGVFVGISHSEYGQMQMADPAMSNTYAGTGSALSIAANRLSYWLDVSGPSLAVDTACSSSLVAFHMACRALAQGECSVALAAGTNLLLSPAVTVNFTKGHFMARDGRCKAFDARADGYVRGEGIGVVVLKALSRALEDGDTVYAVCLGGAVNQDGRSNGLTAPNPRSQERVLQAAYERAGVSPGAVSYIEAHGTGTALGDPIEARALARVLGQGRPQRADCLLGSVKTNVGHLEAAAGIAGVIKTALALHHGEIPRSLHFESANPEIPFQEMPLEVVTEPRPWPPASRRRLAGVSSFGFGGTNAHVVLAEAPEDSPGSAEAVQGPFLLPLSAHDPETLTAQARRLRAWLEGDGATAHLGRLCATAARHRSHHDHRLALTFDNREELLEGLQAALEDEPLADIARGRRRPDRRRKLAWVFPGHGSQWVGMGRELLERETVFRQALEGCAAAMEPFLRRPLVELLEDEEGRFEEDVESTQMVLFAVQVALAALWAAWGIRPDAVVGHSVGEVAAAYVAGALSLEQAVEVIARRGQLIRPLAGAGGMLAVALDAESAGRRIEGLEDRLTVGVINAPQASVLSGESGALSEVKKQLEEEGIFHRRVPIAYASHSPQMVPLAARLEDRLAGLQASPPRLEIYSTVRGERAAAGDFGAAYWGRNLREPVLFRRAVTGMLEDGFDLFLEVSAHPVLLRPIEDTAGQGGCETFPSLRRHQPEKLQLLRAAGGLYCRGASPDWRRLQPAVGRLKLPSYAWQRQRYWIEPRSRTAPLPASGAPGSGSAADLWASHTAIAHQPGTHVWTGKLGRAGGAAADPASPVMLFLALSQEAVFQVTGDPSFQLLDFELCDPAFPPDIDRRDVQLVLSREGEGEARFDLFSLRPAAGPPLHGGEWIRHASGRIILSHPLKIAS